MQNLINDIQSKNIEVLANAPHFWIADEDAMDDDIVTIDDEEQFKQFDSFSSRGARVFTLLTLYELEKFKNTQL